jgi:hypothetical protein
MPSVEGISAVHGGEGVNKQKVMERTVDGQIEGFTKESEIGQPIF